MNMKTIKLYQNKEWLEEKYIKEKLSTYQIGKLCNTYHGHIKYWIKKYNFPIRSINDSMHLYRRKQINDDRYCNKEWLRNKYLEEKLDSPKIAEICGVKSPNTIRHWLKEYSIKIRSISEAIHLKCGNHCNLSQEAIEWINGELLGDGCLASQSLCSAHFQYGSKYLEYIKHISDTLTSYNINQLGNIRKYCNKEWGNYSYSYSSSNYAELYPIYKQWYPEGKKIIPKDIELTPLTCRQWYIGDGSLDCQKKQKPCIKLATCGFTISDVNWIIKELTKLGFKAMRQKYNNTIRISTYSTKKFLDYIGNCPTKCYQYKFDYYKKDKVGEYHTINISSCN